MNGGVSTSNLKHYCYDARTVPIHILLGNVSLLRSNGTVMSKGCTLRCDGWDGGDEERIYAALTSFKNELERYLDKEPAASALFERRLFHEKFERFARISGFKWIHCGSCKKPFADEEQAWSHFQRVNSRLPKTVFESVQPEVRRPVLINYSSNYHNDSRHSSSTEIKAYVFVSSSKSVHVFTHCRATIFLPNVNVRYPVEMLCSYINAQ